MIDSGGLIHFVISEKDCSKTPVVKWLLRNAVLPGERTGQELATWFVPI